MTPQQLRAVRTLDRLSEQLEPRTRETFRAAIRRLQLGADVNAATLALATGNIDGAIRALLPANATAAFAHLLNVAVARIVADVGPQTAREVASSIQVKFTFIPGSRQAAEAMRRMNLGAIVPVQRDAEAGLRSVLTEGLFAGRTSSVMAREARAFVGLTSYDAQLIASFAEQLRTDPATALTRELRDQRYDRTVIKAIDGTPLTDAQIGPMTARYTEALHTWRSETWARTTTRMAIRQTQDATWRQAASDLGISPERLTKTWITVIDGRERDTHHALHGETVPINERYSNGDDVPGDGTGIEGTEYNCRCIQMIRVSTEREDNNRRAA